MAWRSAVAGRGARARARAHARAAAPHLCGRHRDAGLGLPQAARRRPLVPARVRRAGAALRALVVSRLPPAGGDPAGDGTLTVGGEERRPPTRTRRSTGSSSATGSRRSRACRRSPAARWACSATTSSAPQSRPSGRATRTSVGMPDMALMVSDVLVAFDHLRHEITILANVFVEDDVDEAYDAGGQGDRRGARAARRAGAPRARRAPGAARLHQQHRRRRLRQGRGAVQGVHPRRRRLPGGAQPALERGRAGRGLLDLPRPARHQPQPLHVLPRLRGLRDRRRVAGVADQGRRPPRRAAPDRRHPPARRHGCGRPRAGRGAAGRREGARRARDAGGPGPQRPRAGVRVRQRVGRRADGRGDLLARAAHRLVGVGHAARGRLGDGRPASVASGRNAVRRARRSARCRSSTSSSR